MTSWLEEWDGCMCCLCWSFMLFLLFMAADSSKSVRSCKYEREANFRVQYFTWRFGMSLMLLICTWGQKHFVWLWTYACNTVCICVCVCLCVGCACVGGSQWEVSLWHPFSRHTSLKHTHRMPCQLQLLCLDARDVENSSHSAIRAADCWIAHIAMS